MEGGLEGYGMGIGWDRDVPCFGVIFPWLGVWDGWVWCAGGGGLRNFLVRFINKGTECLPLELDLAGWRRYLSGWGRDWRREVRLGCQSGLGDAGFLTVVRCRR